MPSLSEADIKSRMIDYFLSKHAENDHGHDILATEVPFADFQRRADLIKINGSVHAYEIKSDLDDLKTLTAQISHYQKTFDKVSVVLTKTHIKNARAMLPDTVGIIYIDGTEIKRLRKARYIKRLDKYFLSCFLDRFTIEHLLQERSVKKNKLKHLDITQLRQKLSAFYRTDELKNHTLNVLKLKYSEKFFYFLNYRGNVTHTEDLIELGKGSGSIQ